MFEADFMQVITYLSKKKKKISCKVITYACGLDEKIIFYF